MVTGDQPSGGGHEEGGVGGGGEGVTNKDGNKVGETTGVTIEVAAWVDNDSEGWVNRFTGVLVASGVGA